MVYYQNEELDISISKNSEVDSKLIIRDFDFQEDILNFKRKFNNTCKICGENFITPGYKPTKICNKHHFFYVCDYCGKEFKIKRLSDFSRSSNNLRFCSYSCSLNHHNRTPEMKQTVIKKNKTQAKENISKIQICSDCGREFKSIFPMSTCNSCIAKENNKNNFKLDQVCSECGNIFHSTFIMTVGHCCNSNIGGIPNFEVRDGLYYKGKPWNKCCEEFENGRIEPGIEKRLGIWTYYGIDPLTDEKIYMNQGNFAFNKILYYKNEPWEEVKKEVYSKIPTDIQLFADEIGGFIQPTYFENNIDTTGKIAFEKDILDKGINYFVYIKFCRKDNGYIPIQCGESASNEINDTGSDLNFSIKNKDKAAVRFLIEEKLQWCNEYIAIIKTNSKKESLDIERNLQINYNLFG